MSAIGDDSDTDSNWNKLGTPLVEGIGRYFVQSEIRGIKRNLSAKGKMQYYY